MTISPRAIAVLTALTLLPLAAFALLGSGDRPDPARAQAVPSLTSSNVQQLKSLPGTSAISGVFSRSAPFFYVSGLETLSVIDVKDPKNPQVVGKLENAIFENEAMTLGERIGPDGEIQRFVLLGIDLYQAGRPSAGRPGNIGGTELAVVDVTDPRNPEIIGRTPSTGPNAVTTSTHTVACMNAACTVAYSAGGDDSRDNPESLPLVEEPSALTRDRKFSIIDLSDLTAPKQVKTVVSPASQENPTFTSSAGHHWNVDGAGLAWHTGAGGTAGFDISDPVNPLLVNGTDANGRKPPYNDFIHHNSQRPNARAFRAGQAPSLESGNVLLITEEDYANEGDEVDCKKAGSFQTWEVPDLDAERYRAGNPNAEADKGSVRVLDTFQAPVEGGGGASTPLGGFCSAHWFDYHQSGVVAMGNYQQGLRLVNVRDPRAISQFGFATGGASEVWDAYWAPERTAGGATVPGRKTNVVYTVDAVRGVEVFQVNELPADLKVTGDAGDRGSFPGGPGRPTGRDGLGGGGSAGSGSGSGSGGSRCGAPISDITRGSRLTGGGLRLRGVARGFGCRITKVRVAVARKTGKQCRFLQNNGRFSARRSCLRTSYLTTRGTTRWTMTKRVRLPRGRYNVWSRAIDSAGQIERKQRTRNLIRLRVGRR